MADRFEDVEVFTRLTRRPHPLGGFVAIMRIPAHGCPGQFYLRWAPGPEEDRLISDDPDGVKCSKCEYRLSQY